MDKIDFVDVTLRDGQQSLWAEVDAPTCRPAGTAS